MPASASFSSAPASLFPNPRAVRRILVCQLRQIGDVLLATPSIELLARHFPDAELHVFTEKKCTPMLEGNPHIHTLWTVDKKALPTLLHEGLYYREVAARGYDLVVDFQQLPRCRWVVAFSRAKVRLSFPPPWYLRWLYTHWEQPKPAYAAAFKAGVLAPLGITWQGERPRLYLSEAERAEAATLLHSMGLGGKTFVTVDSTHKHSPRRWPARHFAALLDKAAEDDPSLHFFLLYGPGEEEQEVRTLHALCRQKDRVHLPGAMVGLRLMAAIMEQAALHLGVCSSPRHIAVAAGLPSLILLGSTGPGWTFPAPEHRHIQAKQYMDMPCQHCNKNTCPHGLRCLEELTPELVLPVFTEHLKQFGKRL